MPDITISIPTPVLVGTQKFRVRYSSDNGQNWITVSPDQTNAYFTILGLSIGNYLLEIRLVLEDGILCPATYENFTVIDDFECWEFSANIQLNGNTYYIEVSYSGSGNPPCGWILTYNKVGSSVITVPYAILPISPFVIPIVNADYEISIYANLCNGYTKLCFTDILPALPTCKPFSINTGNIILNTPPGSSYITINYTDSIPSTNPVHVIWQQTGNFSNGVADPGGNSMIVPSISGGSGIITIPIHPNITPINNIVEYDIKLIDVCMVEHNTTVTIWLT